MRRPRPELVFSAVALVVSILTLVSGTIWARAAAREDELRAERRVAYSQYFSVATRCSPWLATRTDADLSVEPTARLARVEEQVTECQTDLSAASSNVTLLSDDRQLLDLTGSLNDTLLILWTVRFDMATALDEAALEDVPGRAGGSCAAGEPETLVLEYVGCQFRVGTQQRQYLERAKIDVQAEPPGLTHVALRAAPWLLASAALLGLAILFVRRRAASPPPRAESRDQPIERDDSSHTPPSPT